MDVNIDLAKVYADKNYNTRHFIDSNAYYDS